MPYAASVPHPSNDQNLWMALGGAGVKSRTSPRKI
jgi:hypothetical protein